MIDIVMTIKTTTLTHHPFWWVKSRESCCTGSWQVAARVRAYPTSEKERTIRFNKQEHIILSGSCGIYYFPLPSAPVTGLALNRSSEARGNRVASVCVYFNDPATSHECQRKRGVNCVTLGRHRPIEPERRRRWVYVCVSACMRAWCVCIW